VRESPASGPAEGGPNSEARTDPPEGSSPPAPGGSPPLGPRRPLLRLLRVLLGLGVQLLLLAILLLGLVLGTQTGLRTAIVVVSDLAPGVLRVGKAEGRVLGRLRLEDLELHLPSLDLRLGSLELDWSPLAAVAGTLRVHRLAVRDIDVVAAPAEDQEKQPFALPEVALPIAVEIEEALVERLRVSQPGAEQPTFVLDRATLAARLAGNEVDLTRLEVTLTEPRLSAEATGQARLTGAYPLGVELHWELGLPPSAELRGEGQVSGDLERLVIKHALSGSARARVEAEVKDVLGRLSWDGQISLEGLDLPHFAPGAPRIDLTGRIETQGDLEAATATGRLDGTAPELRDLGRLEANLDVQWKDKALAIRTLDLRESVSGGLLELTGDLDLKPDPGRFKLEGSWERLRWPLAGDLLAESPRGSLEASGTFDSYQYRLSAAGRTPELADLELSLSGSGDRNGTQVEPLGLKALGGSLTAAGTLAWAPEPSWDLRVRGQDLNPAGMAPGLEDRVGLVLETKGGLAGYTYDLAATTAGPGLPPARLALAGTGDRRGSVIETLRLEALDGLIEGHGRTAWDPKLTWEAELVAQGIDPGSYAPEWPGRLDGRILTQGALEADGLQLQVGIEDVAGQLRGYPVAAQGRVRMAGKSIQVDGLKASSGPTVARVDGAIEGESLNLAFDLSSPDLKSLLPNARGSVAAEGRLEGTLEAPSAKLDLKAREVEVAGQGVGSLDGSAELGLTPDGRFDIRVDGKDLVAGGMRFATLTLRGEGGMPNHRLNAGVRGPQLSAQLEATGSLGPDRSYQGNLNGLTLEPESLGTWTLQRPMPVRVQGERVSAGPLCMRNAEGSGGCLGFDQSEAGKWTAEIDLDPLGVELIRGFLPPKLAAEGTARVKGRFQAAGSVLTGNAVAEIPSGRLRASLGGGREEALDFSGARLSLDSGATGMAARLGLPLRDLGEVMGELSLPGWRLDAPVRPDQPLKGGVRIDLDGLSRVATLVPQVTGVTGSIAGDLRLSGTLANPEIRGEGVARALGGEVPLIGLRVKDFNLNLVAGKDRLDLQGQGDVGGGRLEVSGGGALGPSGFAGDLRAAGERLKVADTKEYFALVSPSFQIDLSAEGAQVRGEIRVPEARIRPRAIPTGTVTPSPDVAMIDKATEKAPPYPVDIDVRLKLGDDVTIDAFGVRGRLTGDLRVFQQPGRQMLGDGQLAIADGLYRLSGGFGLSAEVGVPLTIEQGRLVFAKSPIDNPGLLIQAQREGGDTTAGVQVLGTLRKPKLAFFSQSDPDMTQADITKYLLTGVPPRRDAGAGDRGLSLGTYVRPKLYMEYEKGLGDQKDKVKLRYDLTRHIEVQTETGEGQGGDIFFKFER
jgi:translocation and assembly module TamB